MVNHKHEEPYIDGKDHSGDHDTKLLRNEDGRRLEREAADEGDEEDD
jgi:hypothetical protein